MSSESSSLSPSSRPGEFTPDQLAKVQQFFDDHHADCFWSWNPKVRVTNSNVFRVLEKVRTYGGSEGRELLSVILSGKSSRSSGPGFLFFPIHNDGEGHRLSNADAAICKVLAAASRMDPRDYVECLFLHQTYCSLGTLIWAASGTDSGLSSEFILNQLIRNSQYTREQLEEVIDPEIAFETGRMKECWLMACDEAKRLIAWLPPEDAGCLYLTPAGKVATPTPETISSLVKLRAHEPTPLTQP
ncbi:MAG: hypothetical protein QM680_07255 [Luteolibacter sp.]